MADKQDDELDRGLRAAQEFARSLDETTKRAAESLRPLAEAAKQARQHLPQGLRSAAVDKPDPRVPGTYPGMQEALRQRTGNAAPLDSETVLSNADLHHYGYRTAQADLRQDIADAVDKHQGAAVEAAQGQSMSHGSPSDRTLATYLDYTGLGAILIATEELGRRWIEEQPITQHVVVATTACMVGGGIALAVARRVKAMPPAAACSRHST